jgi:hypothetical protein
MIFNRVFYGLCGESVTTVMTFELHFHFELHFRITLSFIFSNFLIFYSSSASKLVRSACGRHLGHSYLIQLVELRITLSRWATRCDMRVLASHCFADATTASSRSFCTCMRRACAARIEATSDLCDANSCSRLERSCAKVSAACIKCASRTFAASPTTRDASAAPPLHAKPLLEPY